MKLVHLYYTLITLLIPVPLHYRAGVAIAGAPRMKKVLVFLTFEGYTCSMGVGIAFNKVPPSFKIAAANLNK